MPPQQEIVRYIRNALNKLEAASIRKVKIYGKQTGSDFPVWDQEFDLTSIQPTFTSNVTDDLQVISPVNKSRSFKVNEDKTLLECNGNSTILIVKERGVLIRRLGGFMSAHTKGERFIAYNNIINNIQIYPSTTLKYSFIYFQTIRSSISILKYLETASNHRVWKK